MIYLICGPIGAGKTTYARQLATTENAICFSEDEWLARLFVPDAPDGLLEKPIEVIGAWASEKYQRCRGQIWLVCQQLLDSGISVVLDGAAATLEQRETICQKAKSRGVGFQLHYVTAETEIRQQRILQRNAEQGETYSLWVTSEMFTYMEHFFEAPKGGECLNALVTET